jgi:TonB-dependent SusC/RagA subfamily outer membrane receptor
LKDASSTAIYGARGANGVIMVTTKRGKSGESTITYGLDLSVPTAGPKRAKVLNAKQYMQVEDLAYKNMEKFDPAGWAEGKYKSHDPLVRRATLAAAHPDVFTKNADGTFSPNYDTDWFKESTQHRVSQNHQLGFSGGNERTTYSLSLNYRDDQGLIKTSYLKRYSTRFSIDDQVKKWLRLGRKPCRHQRCGASPDGGRLSFPSCEMAGWIVCQQPRLSWCRRIDELGTPFERTEIQPEHANYAR